ncbi:MFS transporter [Methanophagales archaeon]|nr:MAG: MFS transporter [Methanophagales archaeon]
MELKMVSKQAIIESFRKGFRDKTKFFIPFIFLLTVAVVIFGLFNIDLFNKLPITAILSTIAGALAAILAIVFAISQIIISNLSERYSPYILERYKNDPKTMRTLFGFVTVITLSILLLFINAFLPPTISFMLLSALLFGFVYSFSSFIKYFYFMFEIINPLEFASILEKETIEHIKNQNEKEIQNYISSMGDISVKSLQRNEERVCNEYIQTLYNVFDEFFNLKEANPEKYKPVVNLSYYDRDNAKNNILGYVLDQYSRIYKEAVFRKAEGITMETYLKMSFILDKCFRGKDTNLVEQMLKAEYLLSEFTIENKDKSRFYLIHHLTEKQGRIEDKHLDKFISSHLFEVTRLIIDHDDFELFKSEIDYFSMGSIQSPDKIQEEIKDELYLEDMHDSIYQNEEIFKEIEGKRNYLQFLIKYTLSKDFENKKEFEEKLEEFEELVIGHLEKMKEGTYYKSKILREFDEITTEEFENVKRQIEDSIKKVKEKIEGNEHELRSIKHWLKEHYITSKVHKTFFVIGAYILFKGKEGRIDAERYLRELWEHTHPEDAHAIIGNETPVTFDPSWLTYLLFYGGKNSAIWLHDMGVRFEGFHGTTVYAYQYYLLCIAKSIEKGGNNLGLPQRNDLEKMLKENRTYELEELYQFTNGFKLETDEHLIKYCDVLIKESDNWNALFKNNAKEALEKTKEWVNTTSKECKTVKEEIETILPLDLEKVAKCREDIFKSYKESSEIPEVVQVKEFGEERDKELEFIQIYKSPLIRKDCLIKPSFVDCSTRWFELGRSVAVGEINYLIKRILEDERIERVGLRARGHEKIFNEIKSVAGSLKEQNYKPSVVFIPLEIFTEFVKKRLAKRSEHLRIDEDTELKVINSSKLTPFEDIIILDKTAGIWTFEPDEEAEGRLVIEIKEYDADKSKVDLLAKTVVNFRIVDPNAIKILKIKQGSSISARMK